MSELPVPGTVHQVDSKNQLQGVRRSEHQQDIILLPPPSDHPDDPLNWSKWRKWATVVGHNIYTFGTVCMVSAYTPANLQIEATTGIPVANINTGVGIYFLFIGYANLIWQPLAIHYGRRPVLLLSLLMVIAMTIWQAYCNTTSEWYANRVMMGIAAAPIETLLELIVADLHFSHERGFYMSIYVWLLFSGPFLSCIPAGFIADAFGWQWINYTAAIIGGGWFICLFFLLEETSFYRPEVISAEALDGFGGKILTDAQSTQVESQQKEKGYEAGEVRQGSPAPSTQLNGQSGIVGEPKPYWKRLGLTSGYDPRRKSTIWKNIYLCIFLFQFPAVIYSGLMVGLSLSWFNVVNGILPTVLGSEPYNFDPNMIGIFYIAAVIGVSVGSYFSGQLSDTVAIYMARRNNGVFEPEHRLWVFLLALILHPFGCLLFGIGAARDMHWIGLAFGLGLFCAALPMGSNVAYNYVIDSYKEVAGEGLVTVVLIRNTIGKFDLK